MQRLQAFKYELMPDASQERQMRRFAGSCRFVFNKALALQKERYEQGEKKLDYAGLCKLLTEWRNSAETVWLADAPVHPQQQTLKDLERAYKNFFAKRADFPRFKKKGQSDSFRYPDSKQIKLDQGNSRIFLPKLGWLRYRNSRDVLGTVKNITVSQSCGKWFVSIQTEREVEQPLPQGGAVGIDMGIARFVTMSDGTFYAPLNSFKRHETALRKAQQARSRKTKFSTNWKKAKARVQKIQSRIGNARRDYLHKCSTTISQNHAMVCIEDLQVRNMSKSAAGTADAPGRSVRAKSGLNKSILDQGWFEFRRQLDYKLVWNGGWLVAAPPQNTSRSCPCCGHMSAANRQTQARFECVECGFEENADVVGAINVLRAGHARLACEVSGAVMPPAAGTRRSDSGAAMRPRLSAVGISGLQAGEDVKAPPPTLYQELAKGIWRENPVFVQVLGMCPMLAVTNSAINALAMGLATGFVLVGSSFLVALLRAWIPQPVRIACYVIIIATYVTVVDFSLHALAPQVHKELGAFIALIVANCLILGRQEAFAAKHMAGFAVADALGSAGGFMLALLCLGSVRELLGSGSLFGLPLFGAEFEPWVIMLLPPGGVLTLGLILLFLNWLEERRAAYTLTATAPAEGS